MRHQIFVMIFTHEVLTGELQGAEPLQKVGFLLE